MTEPSNLRDAAEVARLIAATLGYEFDHAFRDKAEWIKERGEKGGRFHDVNEPYQTDFMYAAEEVTKAVGAATIAKVVAWLRETARLFSVEIMASEGRKDTSELLHYKWACTLAAEVLEEGWLDQ